MEELLSEAEAVEVNLMSARELDRQVLLGNFYPVLIIGGRIAGCINEDTPTQDYQFMIV